MSSLQSSYMSRRLVDLTHTQQRMPAKLVGVILSAQLWIFLSLVLSLWVSGCQPTDQGHLEAIPEANTQLTIWHAYRGTERAMLEAHLREFQEQTGQRVRSLHLPYNAFANKLQVAIPRGNGPDLFIFAHDRVGDWAEAGLIEPIGFWMSPQLQNQFLKTKSSD